MTVVEDDFDADELATCDTGEDEPIQETERTTVTDETPTGERVLCERYES